MKRRKRSSKRRRQNTLLLLVISLFIFGGGPLGFHIERMRQSKNDYDVQKVQDELLWMTNYAGPLNKLELIKDTEIWLELNQGNPNVEQKLASYQDEKHQFWLAMFYLQGGDLNKSQARLQSMTPSARSQLGKGLLSLTKGDAKQTQEDLAETEADWASLSRQDQCLRHLTLAKAALSLEDKLSSSKELEVAQQLDPNNPSCLTLGFEVALTQGDWEKAIKFSQLIDGQTWRPQNSLYVTKRAILAIQENDEQGLSRCLTLLKNLPLEEGNISYVNGIISLKNGQLPEGKTLLEHALKSGLEGEVQADAQKALDQVLERQNADRKLRTL